MLFHAETRTTTRDAETGMALGLDDITSAAVAEAIRIHRWPGPGLLADLQVGLLLNFGCATMKEGIKRVVNDLPPSASQELRVNQQE